MYYYVLRSSVFSRLPACLVCFQHFDDVVVRVQIIKKCKGSSELKKLQENTRSNIKIVQSIESI